MKNKKLIITISSLAILAVASFAVYNFYTKSSNKRSVEENIVANYKGGYVTLNQAQIELNKLAVQNSDVKVISFESLETHQKEIIIKEIVLKKSPKNEEPNNLNSNKDFEDKQANLGDVNNNFKSDEVNLGNIENGFNDKINLEDEKIFEETENNFYHQEFTNLFTNSIKSRTNSTRELLTTLKKKLSRF